MAREKGAKGTDDALCGRSRGKTPRDSARIDADSGFTGMDCVADRVGQFRLWSDTCMSAVSHYRIHRDAVAKFHLD